uniref:GrpE protein homolog n=1 Tax=Araucaria cunninghamii TaxID=56994 RepID=A0A0D6QWK4_ARACU
MNSSRALAGLLRKSLVQSRGLKVCATPLVPKRFNGVQEIIQSPHKWLWGACEKLPIVSLSHSGFITQKVSLFSSVTSPDISQKESNTDTSANKGDETVEPVHQEKADSMEKQEAVKEGQAEAVKRVRPKPRKAAQAKDSDAESESESDKEISTEELIRLVEEKEELLKAKHKEIQLMQDKVLRSYAEVENVMDRTRRDAENSKKFAIQSFAKSLLDVADNLSRASSVVKERFSKLDASEDSKGAVALLKTLLDGVDMTEKQLLDVFNKYGVEKFDPSNEPFDPHRHMAVFQIQDPSKLAGTVGVVLKAGYMLHDRVIRPAEVGVVEAVDLEASEGSEARDSEATESSKST